jgi:uncharacterized protein (TIGR00375 family)
VRIVADLHVHSKYARATSPRCDIAGLAEGAKIKGIDVIATGDFTHPEYFNEIRRDLSRSEDGSGLYLHGGRGVRFILSTEIALIYTGKLGPKRMHHVVLSPSLDTAAQINDELGKRGNLRSDGRPILGISSPEFADILFSISPDIMIIPAHAWTPWFSIFGSQSGVDTVEEAFEDKAGRIYAIETGLSSDPAMNWMLSRLDKYSLVSNSDAHSLEKLGREANVFELEEPTYKSLTEAIKTRKGFEKTFEFYPEEGKYHYDGHRDCGVIMSPAESKARGNTCPSCGKKLTIGVLHRVSDLADRKEGAKPEGAVPFQYIVPLSILLSKALRKPETSKAVAEEYSKLIRYFGNEFAVFGAKEEQLRLAAQKEIADAIMRVNTGRVRWVPGYDGVFGQLVLDDTRGDAPGHAVDRKQKSLGDF